MRRVKNMLLGAFMTAAAVLPSFGQQNTPLPETPKPKTHLVHKGMVWGQKSTDFRNNDLTLLFVSTVKHPKLKGFGVMGLIATRPRNIGKNEQPIVPLGAVFLHYGNGKANINLGPVFRNNGQAGIDGYRLIANLKDGSIGLRVIADADGNVKRIDNIAVHGIYAISDKFDATLGVNSALQGSQSIQMGMAYKL